MKLPGLCKKNGRYFIRLWDNGEAIVESKHFETYSEALEWAVAWSKASQWKSATTQSTD